MAQPDSAESLLLAAVQDVGSAAVGHSGEPALFVGMLQVVGWVGECLSEGGRQVSCVCVAAGCSLAREWLGVGVEGVRCLGASKRLKQHMQV